MAHIEFKITDEDKKFLEMLSPTLGENKIMLSEPTLNPLERNRRRMSHRNERHLYNRKCDKCSKQIISIYSPNKPFAVYCQECFWGDDWDAKDYGRDFDFSRPFFEQFAELMEKVPRLAIVNKQCENSQYCNYSFANKNCYLTFGNHYEEDCMYGQYSTKNKDCLDYYWTYKSELCYELTYSKNCYGCVYLDHSNECRDCYFSYDLKNCSNCLFCAGLRNKEYCIFNKQLSKEEYEKAFKAYKTNTYSGFRKAFEFYRKDFRQAFPFKSSHFTNCENIEGDNHQNSKNLTDCFNGTDCEDCRHGFQMDATYNCMDTTNSGYDKCEFSYEFIGCNGVSSCLFCDSCWHDDNLIYCNLCFNSKNLFGCIGINRGEYYILNKQYSKEEYEELVPRIIEHMKSTPYPYTGQAHASARVEWGEFFPTEISPFGYNETIANDHFPLKKEDALKALWKWEDENEKGFYDGPRYEIPDDIKDVEDDIPSKVLVCEVSGKPYKVISKEFEFYKKMKLPIPRRSPNQRHADRMSLINSGFLWDRACDSCAKNMRVTYSPEQQEKVYCEECYQKSVYN